MAIKKKRVSSGVPGLDTLLSGLFIGDNVIWYDDAGSLASAFCMKFIQESEAKGKPIVYVTFDRSPKNLIDTLGPLAENQSLTILDCFTNGKGDKAEIFNKFYEKDGAQWPYQVIRVTQPWKPESVSDAIYGLHKNLSGDVRFVIESLTGMQDLWEGEDHILKFYSRSCPKLYELDTIAYWILEKGAHSGRLKAHINQVAQVAVDLSVKRGQNTIRILKAENRTPKALNEPVFYTVAGGEVAIEGDRRSRPLEVGKRIKTMRKKQGISQKDLSAMIGVTPSNISQIESSLIYPSLPALMRIADSLSVEVASFFQDRDLPEKTVFRNSEAIRISRPDLPREGIVIEQLTPQDLHAGVEVYRVRIEPGTRLPGHFFMHKGEEIGHLLEGRIQVEHQDQSVELGPGDTLLYRRHIPGAWTNPGPDPAVLLWQLIV